MTEAAAEHFEKNHFDRHPTPYTRGLSLPTSNSKYPSQKTFDLFPQLRVRFHFLS